MIHPARFPHSADNLFRIATKRSFDNNGLVRVDGNLRGLSWKAEKCKGKWFPVRKRLTQAGDSSSHPVTGDSHGSVNNLIHLRGVQRQASFFCHVVIQVVLNAVNGIVSGVRVIPEIYFAVLFHNVMDGKRRIGREVVACVAVAARHVKHGFNHAEKRGGVSIMAQFFPVCPRARRR